MNKVATNRQKYMESRTWLELTRDNTRHCWSLHDKYDVF
jgi:hypothetical protein